MFAIRLENTLMKGIAALAKIKHTPKSTIVREAIVHYLDDSEDLELAKLAQNRMKTSKELKELRKELGLDC